MCYLSECITQSILWGKVRKHNETFALKAKYVFNSLGPIPTPMLLMVSFNVRVSVLEFNWFLEKDHEHTEYLDLGPVKWDPSIKDKDQFQIY